MPLSSAITFNSLLTNRILPKTRAVGTYILIMALQMLHFQVQRKSSLGCPLVKQIRSFRWTRANTVSLMKNLRKSSKKWFRWETDRVLIIWFQLKKWAKVKNRAVSAPSYPTREILIWPWTLSRILPDKIIHRHIPKITRILRVCRIWIRFRISREQARDRQVVFQTSTSPKMVSESLDPVPSSKSILPFIILILFLKFVVVDQLPKTSNSLNRIRRWYHSLMASLEEVKCLATFIHRNAVDLTVKIKPVWWIKDPPVVCLAYKDPRVNTSSKISSWIRACQSLTTRVILKIW